MHCCGSSIRSTAFGELRRVAFGRHSRGFERPLLARIRLHTWSLSVEWQFYCVWPLLLSGLLALFRRRMVWPILAITVLGFWLIFAFQDGSFWLLAGTRTAEWLSDGRATVFYNTPFRVFEFACGAALVWLPQPRALAIHEFLALLG
ncbi:MAG: hypothetical protein E5W21_31690, partial [Mesorhizobium sp.]